MSSSNNQRDFRNKVHNKDLSVRILDLPQGDLSFNDLYIPEYFYSINIENEEYILLFLYVLYETQEMHANREPLFIDELFFSNDLMYLQYNETIPNSKPNISKVLKGKVSNYKYESALDAELKYTDVTMLCIPLSNFSDPINIRTLTNDILTYAEPRGYYESNAHGFVVNKEGLSPHLSGARSFGSTPNLEDNLKSLASWGTIMVPLTDSKLQMENRPKGVQKALKSIEYQFARDYIREQIASIAYDTDEDLDMVKMFLEDPMNEDAFETLAEYMFPERGCFRNSCRVYVPCTH